MSRYARFLLLAGWFCAVAACGGGGASNPMGDDGGDGAAADDASLDSAEDGTKGSADSRADVEHQPDATSDGDAGGMDAADGGDASDASDADANADATLDATDAADAADAADATVIDAADSGDASLPDSGDAGVLSWRPLSHQPPFMTDTALLLTDGTVMVHASDDPSNWWRLTPDAFGSYANGTWTQLASLPNGYGPTYFASAVLPDGRVIVEGGEYNGDGGNPVDTSLGAIYDPLADKWTPVSPPSGWSYVGDAPGAVLANGVFMMGNATTSEEALFDAGTLTWTTTGTGKGDINEEEGWTLLPSGKLLTVDCTKVTQSETYDPGGGAWSSAGVTPVSLVDQSEIGPAVLRPNGDVLAMGATQHTAVFHANTWSAGPDLPTSKDGQLVLGDAPAVLLPNGHVLAAASPGLYNPVVYFLDYDGVSFQSVPAIPNAAMDVNFFMRLIVLPSGEVMELDGTTDVELGTPTGAPDPSWLPAITTVPSTVTRGSTFTLHGTQLNGLSQAAEYGDDVQDATNYPLVRITNQGTGHVFYARTHDHSSMGVATGNQDVSTSFDVPMAADTGPSTLVVVVNGIASAPASVTVQ